MRGSKKVDKDTFRSILETKIEFIEKEAEGIFSEENKKIVGEKSFAGVAAEGAQKEQVEKFALGDNLFR